MLNIGSTALPYQPYSGIAIKGNMQQNGTPTPTSPIAPQECGERTENLLDYSTFVNDYWLNNNTGLPQPYNNGGRIATTSSIDVNNVNNVTFDFTSGMANTQFMYSLFNGSTLIERVTGLSRGTTIDVSNGDTLYLCLYRTTGLPITISDVSNAMLNVGSTAKPYEPYGYKLPIVSGGVTTNAYLGEVQSTRKIKKLVLTGGQDESWTYSPSGGLHREKLEDIPYAAIIECVCSHYKYEFANVDGNVFINSTLHQISFCDNVNATDDTTWRAYLAAQYAAGTPVTVWYVLANETTGIVNEPIRKIDSYADSVSVTGIPTTSGGQTFDVATTLKPSEVDLTYHGWHEHEAEKRENGQWV